MSSNGDSIPSEIEDRMFIKRPTPMPDTIEGHLTARELEEYPEEDRPMLLAVSKLQQMIMLHWTRQVIFMEQARQSEAFYLKRTDKILGYVRWILGGVLLAFLGAYFAYLFKT